MEREVFIPGLGQLIASESLLSAFDVERIATEALLFQTGYLTIDSVRQFGVLIEYRLRYPNLEVGASLNGALLEQITSRSDETMPRVGRLFELLQANDFDGIEQLFSSFFASIPTDWYRNNPIARYEGYYAGVFYTFFASLGLDISDVGRMPTGRSAMTTPNQPTIHHASRAIYLRDLHRTTEPPARHMAEPPPEFRPTRAVTGGFAQD